MAGERRLVAVLFADVSGFTAMSEKLDHEETNAVMRACWAELDRVVLAYGGTVDKHIGDCLMGTFGATVAHEDDPLRAVAAGLELQRRLAAFSERLRAAIGVTLRMRCGIAAGEVTVDYVATSTHELSVIGPRVNLASRLEHECEVGSVFVSEDVYRATAWAIDYRPIEPRAIKGIEGLVPIYEALAEKEARRRAPDRQLASGDRLVGRAAERATLRGALDEAIAGWGRVAALVGEAGIGKSTLAADLRQAAEGAGVRIVHARSLSHLAVHPYSLVREALRSLLQVDTSTPAATVHARLETAIGGQPVVPSIPVSLTPAAAEAALTPADRVALLGRLLLGDAAAPLAAGADQRQAAGLVDALDPAVRHRLTVQAARDLLLAQARLGRPLLLDLEDLHWADPSSLDVVRALVEALQTERLLLLLQARPDLDLAWLADRPRVRVLPLAAFSLAEAARLVAALLDLDPDLETADDAAGSLAHSLAERLHAATQGNPYFLSEVVQSLQEQGALVHDGAAWRLAEEDVRAALPESVRRLLLARMDTLEAAPRLVLQEAAVVGHSFERQTVEAISEVSPAVQPALDELERRQLVRRVAGEHYAWQEEAESLPAWLADAFARSLAEAASRPPSTAAAARDPADVREYRHGLLRDAAYEALAVARRERYHARLGLLLERRHGASPDAGALVQLAHHFTQSDRADRAAHYALLAAEQAAAQFANQEALFWFDRAADALARLEGRGRGALAAIVGEPAGTPGQPPGQGSRGEQHVRLLRGRAAVEVTLGRYAVAAEHLEEALRGCEAALHAWGAAHVPQLCRMLAALEDARGSFDRALGWVRRGLAAAGAGTIADDDQPQVPPRDPAAVVRLCLLAALVHWRRGEQVDAAGWAERAIALSDTAGAAATDLAQIHNLLCVLHRDQGRIAEAVAHGRTSLERYEALGDVVGTAKAHTNLGCALLDLGDTAGARAHHQRSRDLARRIGDPWLLASAENNLGEVFTRLGELEEARQRYAGALPLLEAADHQGATTVRMNLAWIALEQGDGATALDWASRAEADFAARGLRHQRSEVLRYRADALRLLGRGDDALAVAREALAEARAQGRRLEEGQALRTLGQALLAVGRTDEARQALRTSREALEALGALGDLGRTLLAEAAVAGHVEEAVALRRRAADLFRQAGAAPDLAAAEAQLASAPPAARGA